MSDCIAENKLRWQPPNYLQQLKDLEKQCVDTIALLKEEAQWEAAKNWAPHLDQMVDTISPFRDICRDEIDHFGEFRYHGFQVDEVIDFIEEDLEGLVQWLGRMIGLKQTAE
jgi:hypothetical protein